MGFYRRPVLSRAEQNARFARQKELERENMTAADIGALMRKTIHDSLDRFGSVEEKHLQLANVPQHSIDTRFAAILAEVQQERANGGITA